MALSSRTAFGDDFAAIGRVHYFPAVPADFFLRLVFGQQLDGARLGAAAGEPIAPAEFQFCRRAFAAAIFLTTGTAANVAVHRAAGTAGVAGQHSTEQCLRPMRLGPGTQIVSHLLPYPTTVIFVVSQTSLQYFPHVGRFQLP